MSPPDPGGPGVGVAIANVARAVAAGERLDGTLGELVRAATEHAGARYGALGVLAPDGKRLERFVVAGATEEDAARIGRLPSGEGVLRLLVDDPAPLRLDDLGSHPASVGFPPGHPEMGALLAVPVRVGDAVFGHLYLTEKRDGGRFTDADEEAVVALAAAAGLAVDNARLAESAEQQRAWAQAGAAVVTSLLSGADPDQVWHEIAERVVELCSADHCAVLVPRDDDAFTLAAAAGEVGTDAAGVRLPMAGITLSWADTDGGPLLIDDVTEVVESQPHAPVVQELVSEGYGPGLVIPIRGGRPAPAAIVAVRRAGRPAFDPVLLELATTFAAQLAVALELASSQRRERDLRLTAERDRIARDLHDHVVQRIYATGLALDRISRSLEATAPEAATRIAARVDELDETIARIRTAIFELHDAAETSPDAVRGRLSAVVRSVTEDHGLRVDLRVRDSTEDLSGALVHDVVAAVRELVTNVVRHAAATRVTVEVTADKDVSVVVTDDGQGMPPVTARSGLANLADRAERRGGRMEITSGSSGTSVHWSVPHP